MDIVTQLIKLLESPQTLTFVGQFSALIMSLVVIWWYRNDNKDRVAKDESVRKEQQNIIVTLVEVIGHNTEALTKVNSSVETNTRITERVMDLMICIKDDVCRKDK